MSVLWDIQSHCGNIRLRVLLHAFYALDTRKGGELEWRRSSSGVLSHVYEWDSCQKCLAWNAPEWSSVEAHKPHLWSHRDHKEALTETESKQIFTILIYKHLLKISNMKRIICGDSWLNANSDIGIIQSKWKTFKSCWFSGKSWSCAEHFHSDTWDLQVLHSDRTVPFVKNRMH